MNVTAASFPDLKMISVDDHVVEPPTLWTDRLPEKYRNVGPRVEKIKGQVRYQDGSFRFVEDSSASFCDIWRYEDISCGTQMGAASAGIPAERQTLDIVNYSDMRPGFYEASARLADMDVNGIEAALCFPNMFVRFGGTVFLDGKDKELSELCVRAYNDWMLEQWAGQSRGRLISLCILPLWDMALTMREVERIAQRGNTVVAFPEIPPFLNLPSLYTGHWDKFFSFCEESGTVLSTHIGSSPRSLISSADSPVHMSTLMTFAPTAMAIFDWIASGVLVRHPRLKLHFAECQIGWIPYLLERMDRTWRQYPNWGWAENKTAKTRIPELPSTYFHRNMLVTVFDDEHGLQSLDKVGVDNVAFETDYPHADGTWPNSIAVARDRLKHLDVDVYKRLMRNNAIRFFDLELGRA